MTIDETIEYTMSCDFCGHESHMIIAAVSLPDGAPVHCPQCGGQIATLEQLLPVGQQQAESR